MNRFLAFVVAGFSAFAGFIPASATAQQILYVGNVAGANDGGSCTTATAPCGSISSAMSKVNMDGAVISCVAPSVGISPVAITYSVTIDCRLSAQPYQANLISINAPGKTVRISNTQVNCSPSCFFGFERPAAIEITAAGSVTLDNVTVLNSPTAGILDRRAGPGRLTVVNSRVSGITGSGIVVAPQSGTISALLDNVRVSDANFGLAVGRGGRVSVRQSIFSGTFTTAVHSDAGGIIELEDVLATMSPTGINAVPGSTVSLANSRLVSNNTGITGSTTSFGGNKFFANATGDGTPPTPAGSASSDYGLR